MISLRLILLVALVAVFTSACNLGSNMAEPTEEGTPIARVTNTVQAAPTATPTATQTRPAPVVTNTRPAPTAFVPTAYVPPCTPRTDWPYIYSVQAGDTLARIAARVNSTASAIAAANCIANANQISVGQQIRLPFMPTVTAIPTTPAPGPIQLPAGEIGFSDQLSGDAGMIMLVRDSVITVQWMSAPTSQVKEAEFFLIPEGDISMVNARLMGIDTTPADGFAISWTVLPGLTGQNVVAIGTTYDDREILSYPRIVFSAPPSGQGCEVSPASGPVIIYTEPTTSSEIFATLPMGIWVETVGYTLGGWLGYDPDGPSNGTGGTASLRWIAPNTALLKRGTC